VTFPCQSSFTTILSMQVLDHPAELRARLTASLSAGARVGFVPTMGALHAGHLALVEASRAQTDLTVMSIYINPAQFAAGEDFSRYPRDFDRDLSLAADAGVDILFKPDDEVMYPSGTDAQQVWVDPGALGDKLEGAHRPGHFRGVATVVAKLFNMVRPEAAFFGQKDAQQSIVIRRLVRDLALPVQIEVVPTVREDDGLALSSRNVYLSPEQRKEAPAIFRGLQAAGQAFDAGERRPRAIVDEVKAELGRGAPSASVEYVALTDYETLDPYPETVDTPALLSLAVRFGSTRLIDNIPLLP